MIETNEVVASIALGADGDGERLLSRLTPEIVGDARPRRRDFRLRAGEGGGVGAGSREPRLQVELGGPNLTAGAPVHPRRAGGVEARRSGGVLDGQYCTCRSRPGKALSRATLRRRDFIDALGRGLLLTERRIRRLMALQAFLDHSGGAKRPTFVLTGFISSYAEAWAEALAETTMVASCFIESLRLRLVCELRFSDSPSLLAFGPHLAAESFPLFRIPW